MTHDHYFTADPQAGSSPRVVRLPVGDRTLELTTDAGVFSRARLDPGTEVLLKHLPEPPIDGDLLDLGCGYGPIALSLASRFRDRDVYAVDVNTRALELTDRNARAAGLGRVRVHTPDDVPADTRFAALYSNPPIRIGKLALRELLSRWLDRLAPGGAAFLVVQRNLGADSLAAWLAEQGRPTERVSSHRGYRVLRVGAE